MVRNGIFQIEGEKLTSIKEADMPKTKRQVIAYLSGITGDLYHRLLRLRNYLQT
jgi:hypothetical protein